MSDFRTFFAQTFDDRRQPYDYQERLASLPCESRLISVPIGLGKKCWNKSAKEPYLITKGQIVPW